MSDRKENWLITTIQWLSSLLIVLFGYILFNTFGPVKPPITPINGEYTAIKLDDGTIVVSFKCDSIVHNDFEMHVHREVVHESSGLTVILPTTESAFVKGTRSVFRQFYIPVPVPVGKWCVTSKSEWKPMWSLRDRATNPVTKCFTVK